LIPNNTKNFDVENNLGGEKVKMQISADATVHLMGLLTDLYSDQELACIREYSTNAWDAHIDAGNTDPIQVFTPTHLDPYLTIKDFGIGMDERTIREIYSQYGESTKREQKTTNGSMGIGAKAALSYTNQFTVAGVKNGVKTLVSVSRDEDGSGVMEIVYTGKTSEPNGVEIKIPVKPGNSFGYKAIEFFSYWNEGTVLLNGKSPVVKREALTDRIFFSESRHTDVIVMGNVAYPVDMGNYSISGTDGRKVVCYVEMNGKDEVVFTPSREGLIYNAITKSAVVNLRNEYQAKIREHVNNALTNAKSYHEAYDRYQEYNGKYRWLASSVSWKGIPLSNFQIMDPKGVIDDKGNTKPGRAMFIRYNPNSTYRPVSNGEYLSYSQVRNSEYIVVLGFPARKTISAGNKERIKEFFHDIEQIIPRNRYSYKNIYFTHLTELTNNEVFDYKADHIYKWSDILAVTREPAVAQTKTAGRYHCYDKATGHFTLRDVKEDEKIIFWSPARDAYKPKDAYVVDIANTMPQYTMIADNANRHEKIKKDFKDAQDWYKFAPTYEQMVAKRDFDKLDAEFFEHYYIASNVNRSRDLQIDRWGGLSRDISGALDRLLDKEYARIVRLAFKATKHIGFAANHADFEKAVRAARPKFLDRNLLKDYPMLTPQAWQRDAYAVVEYMNDRFANGKVNN
jgi:hypothetical protein